MLTEEMDEGTAALAACLMEVERHVGQAGWDDAPRLFALVPTAELRAAEPGWADESGHAEDGGELPGHLSAIEQDEFRPGDDLAAALSAVAWPETVPGCALDERGVEAGGGQHTEDVPRAAALEEVGT